MTTSPGQGVPISTVSALTGISPTNLRTWERRYGFPHPERLPGGHRRYSDDDVAAISGVVAEREAGRSLEAAIATAVASRARSTDLGDAVAPTLFAGLRRHHPELLPQVLRRRDMLAISRAIEDECLAQGAEAHLAVAFQRASTYRAARRHRWRQLSRSAASTLVFADFGRSRQAAERVREVAIPRGTPQEREWAVVCDAPASAAVLAGWERLDGRFEAVWTVEPAVVRLASDLAVALAARQAPNLEPPPARTSAQGSDPLALSRAVAITNRVIAYLGRV